MLTKPITSIENLPHVHPKVYFFRSENYEKKLLFPFLNCKDSPGVPLSATQPDLFRGFSFIAPVLIGHQNNYQNSSVNTISNDNTRSSTSSVSLNKIQQNAVINNKKVNTISDTLSRISLVKSIPFETEYILKEVSWLLLLCCFLFWFFLLEPTRCKGFHRTIINPNNGDFFNVFSHIWNSFWTEQSWNQIELEKLISFSFGSGRYKICISTAFRFLFWVMEQIRHYGCVMFKVIETWDDQKKNLSETENFQ